MFLANSISSVEYENIVTQPLVVYNTVAFCELNKSKVDSVSYLSIDKGESHRFAVCFGFSDGTMSCPYSAPFALPVETKINTEKRATMENFSDCADAIEEYAKAHNCKSIRFTLPPVYYQEDLITAWVNTFYCKKYTIANIDVNYAFNLNEITKPDYQSHLSHNSRKNLRQCLNSGLTLEHCESEEAIYEAYTIIAENRSAKGYPLRMTWEQVRETIKIVPHDVFIVRKDGIGTAASLIYHVSDKIAQVIYWGDRPGYAQLRPINYLAYQLINYYLEKEFTHLDIGPSTENSIPNFGLCDFKEGIGCLRSLKFTFCKEIHD